MLYNELWRITMTIFSEKSTGKQWIQSKIVFDECVQEQVGKWDHFCYEENMDKTCSVPLCMCSGIKETLWRKTLKESQQKFLKVMALVSDQKFGYWKARSKFVTCLRNDVSKVLRIKNKRTLLEVMIYSENYEHYISVMKSVSTDEIGSSWGK